MRSGGQHVVHEGRCAISRIAPTRVCRRKATKKRSTGKVVIPLCIRCDERHGDIIGAEVQ